ncbi:sialate O-acetylesterase [Chitinophaga sp. LS1]|uniref:sialate O-acetylesterase n=1 Tax=Chitinophaga sp. LS1 TaxID=3051176 RepID=UPI002AAAB900|nr:sialate O-acetylesterase [Chitinophaga sp. LS1]WPV64130.1 sialate O-acetylesterase [Chitinophaga sp. LS1]
MKQTGLIALLLGCMLSVKAQTISLKGEWQFTTDSAGQWSTVKLPGSMLENNKGEEVSVNTRWTGSIYDSSWYFNPEMAKYRVPGNIKYPFWLTPAKTYVGPAWYKKVVDIPADYADRRITFTMERPHWETVVYVDGQRAGMQNSMSAPHVYDLSGLLSPGRHTILVRIDNRIKEINVGPDSHSLTDHTQGNWNGTIGKLELNAGGMVWMEDVQVYPDVKRRIAKIKLLVGRRGIRSVSGKFLITANCENIKAPLKEVPFQLNKDTTAIVIDYPMGNDVLLWDEFHPDLYELKIQMIPAEGEASTKNITFGMREFKIADTRFFINGKPVFLRGTVDNAVFPLTGYPPMDEASWIRIFQKAKSYGLNHMRFHSWCPPEAAFSAADKVGFYLQPEGPSWANHGTSLGDGLPVDQYIYDETNRIAKAYGNYASFCMLAYGNEPKGGHQVDYLTQFIAYWKEKDNRRVYTGASVGNSWPLVPDNEYMVKAGARGLRWSTLPGSDFDYYDRIKDFHVPYVSHEMGQWCVYPDFTEIPKYTGVYKAKNFEIFRDQLTAHHMGAQAHDFFMASGKLQVLCYKAEIEAALRTPGLAGIQLLSINDYPGQGTALVGVLDPFWNDKPYISDKEWRHFCSPTVLLARIKKFVYTSNDTLHAAISVTNFGEKSLSAMHPLWKVKDKTGKILQQGTFPVTDIPLGDNIPLGYLHLPLKFTGNISVEISLDGTDISNSWQLWVYAPTLDISEKGIYVCDTLDAAAQKVLQDGGKVLLLAAGKVQQGKEVVQSFTPVFWNTSWFKMRPPHTLGILCNPTHPVFADFPTDYYSNYQWWELVNNTQVMELSNFPATLTPLVQNIDTWFLNRRLGMIVEAKVGKGRLIISSIDLNKEGIVTRQLKYSLLKYMQSANFKPAVDVKLPVIQELFRPGASKKVNLYTKDSPDELKPTALRLPAVVGDHMVLQQNADINIWGWGIAGEKVTIRNNWDNKTIATTVGKDGRWQAVLPTAKAGGPYTLAINNIRLSDIYLGEVWLCSGQSNMDMTVAREDRYWCGVYNEAAEVAAANYPLIRVFDTDFTPTDTIQTDVKGKWEICSPATVGHFSAAAYFFARHLQQQLQVPIGLLTTAYGGSTAEAWVSRKELAAHNFQSLLDAYAQKKAVYDTSFTARAKYKTAMERWVADAAIAKAEHKDPPRNPKDPNPEHDQHSPAVLYNGMVAPLIPFTIKGAIWYQGESNANNPNIYRSLMETLVASWRAEWHQGDFPFYYVQLANYGKPDSLPVRENGTVLIRQAQLENLSIPNSGMAVAIDNANPEDPGNIHPKNKQEIGLRLGLIADANVYNKEVAYSGPVFSKMEVQGKQIRLYFEHTDGGLMAKGDTLKGFAIAGADQHFVFANARIDGNTVIVSAPEITKPTIVRYGWAGNPATNLYNKAGLPASPFKTD